METLRFRSVLSVPMLLGDDPIGAITVWHANVGPFSPKHVALLQTFAEQAVIAIENARLFQELTHRTAELETSNSRTPRGPGPADGDQRNPEGDNKFAN